MFKNVRSRSARRPHRWAPAVEGMEPRVVLSAGDGLPEIAFTLENDWGSGFQGTIRLTNDEAQAFEDWTLGFEMPHEINDIWGASVARRDGEQYLVEAASWTSRLEPGKTVEIGFVANTVGATSAPANYDFQADGAGDTGGGSDDGGGGGGDTGGDDSGGSDTHAQASVTFEVVNDWGSGFEGSIRILNDGSEPIRNWVLEFDFTHELTQVWNAEFVSRDGDHYTLRHLDWNAVIEPGQAIRFGFLGAPGNVSEEPTGYLLNGEALDGTPPPPSLAIGDVSIDEGDSGTTLARFEVTLSEPADTEVTVDYATKDGTATAGDDFENRSGTLTFEPGSTVAAVEVPVLGDTLDEGNETFVVELSGAVGARVAQAVGTATILDDDAVIPGANVSDASVVIDDTQVGVGFFHTEGNQIVDANNQRVKIAGVNWFGMETPNFAPHGLWARNYRDMMDQMKDLGFNTIRLPYSNELFDAGSTPNGIDFALNPELQGLSGLQIMDEIVEYAGEIGLRIFLDHHRSDAGAGANGSGLWYTQDYPESRWIDDWVMLAERYAGNPTVIGADLHNEPHGPAQWGNGDLATDWRLAAERAGNAILEVNPEWLIIVEGVESGPSGNYWWGGNLSNAGEFPVRLDVANRLVYSPHDYPSTVFNQEWFSDPDFPNNLPEIWDANWGYLFKQEIAPVLLGEFGSKFEIESDRIWAETLVQYLGGDFDIDGASDLNTGELGVSWTWWSWNPNSGDTGGILQDDWTSVHENKLEQLEPIQFSFDDAPASMSFTVTLTEATSQPVTIAYRTEDGSATAGEDYVATSGTLEFAPGQTSLTVSVPVLSNSETEDETFTLVLSDPDNAEIEDGEGVGLIIRS